MQQNATTSDVIPPVPAASQEPPFPWTHQTEQAALLVAEGKLTEAKIAVKVKVDRTTLWRWKKHPEFAQRVQETVEAFRAAIRAEGIAVLENRLQRLDADWQGMQALRDARAKDARETRLANKAIVDAHIDAARKLGANEVQINLQVADVKRGLPSVAPGMETGLVVRSYKVAGGSMVEEFAFDAALLKEMRGHEEQAAKELGQWTEKKQITGAGGGPVDIRVEDLGQLTDGELRRRLVEARARREATAPDSKPGLDSNPGLDAA